MQIIHAQASQPVVDVSADLLEDNDFIVLMGAVGAFDDRSLPTPAGRVGGRILRVTLMHPQISAFEVLTRCAASFRQLLAENLVSLHYIQPEEESELAQQGSPRASVAWRSSLAGTVTEFRLAAVVASSPLLVPVTQDLSHRPMTDDRRFAYLAAAFAGA